MGLMCDVSKTSDVEETNEKECTHRSICHLVISNMYDIAFSFFAELLTIREWFALALLDNTYRNAIVSAHSRDFSVPSPLRAPNTFAVLGQRLTVNIWGKFIGVLEHVS